MVGENTGNNGGGDNITGKFFYFELNVDTNKSIEQMQANISAAEDRAHVSKKEAEQAKRKEEEARRNEEEARRNAAEEKRRRLALEEEARRNEEEARRNVEEARRNEEEARRNAAEEKRRRLALEAELREVKEILSVPGNKWARERRIFSFLLLESKYLSAPQL